ncbi:RagB/SusD family nutrient uptake outer membrane protein [Sphingobacterium bambusae]|uniref:RagB/SusD family nutrient uptake outer membrane protein n=1 Tax=Sphingobacterium bambusae TaxID=662858 RepID=A0ABW6BAV6_9SPHI|nr:RagB/SusD family nutrient uptake outer membrane protein [Sphingobacterium bambusae]WPL49134.1 RagB/SusD family nutrient uptake outer membrane protein [Sphingobacterium bambusae]
MKTRKNINKKWAKRRNFYLGTWLLLILLTAASCEKILDTNSEIAISSSSVFQTAARIEGLVNGSYKALKSANLYSGRLLMYGDLRGEEFVIRTENALTGGYVWEHTTTNLTGDVNELWAQLYRVINSTNILIEGLKQPIQVLAEEKRLQYLGEAHFLRALCYFNLVSFYGRPYADSNGGKKAVPLRLQPESSSANNDLARSSTAEVYAQIIADLDFAEQNLPLSYTTPLLNTTRAHRNTAIAFKTRVYLHVQNFDKLRQEAEKIVPQHTEPFQATSGVNNKLMADISSIFSSNYTSEESIFSIPMSTEDPPAGSALSNVYYYAPDFVLNSSANGIVSDNTWSNSDRRRTFVRLDAGLNLYLLAKYLKRNPNTDYIPVIRYAEVLLNFAEAEVRSPGGSLAKAVSLVKAIRNRADGSYVFTSESLTSSNILETIARERRIEFLGEGLRSFDITRNLLSFPAKPSLSSFTARQVNPTDEAYVLPLPNGEILTNKLINN